jgi:hypothetical protein
LDYALQGDERETILGLIASQLAETALVAAFGQKLAVDHTAHNLAVLENHLQIAEKLNQLESSGKPGGR